MHYLFIQAFYQRRAKVFKTEEIAKFIKEAPDNVYLLIEIATIFELTGVCRRADLTNIILDDIKNRGNYIIVKIKNSKNHTFRPCVISKEVNNGSYFKLVKKYTSLRSLKTPYRCFFVHFKHVKYT